MASISTFLNVKFSDPRVTKVSLNSLQTFLKCKGGVDLLGSPIFGSHEDFVKWKVKSIHDMQSHLLDIDDPQVDLHLLRSCFSLCKLNYLLRTVPPRCYTARSLVVCLIMVYATLWNQSYIPP